MPSLHAPEGTPVQQRQQQAVVSRIVWRVASILQAYTRTLWRATVGSAGVCAVSGSYHLALLTAEAMAWLKSLVLALPPMSGVRTFDLASTWVMALSKASAAS